MDNPRFCSILLNLQQRLSENDRKRLHVYLETNVSKLADDDSSLSGTLELIQSCFDQDKIDDKDLSSLIDVFQQIQCFDAVNTLEEHQRQMTATDDNPSSSSLASIMPSHIYEFVHNNENEDSYVPASVLIENGMDYRHSNNCEIIDTEQKKSFARKPCVCVPLLKNKCFLLVAVLFICTLGILMVVTMGGHAHVKNLRNTLRTKENVIVKMQNDSNQTLQQLKDQLFEKDTRIQQLQQTLSEIQQKRSTSLIIAGRKFGGDGGTDFDDSSLSMFTYSHYLSGFLLSDIDRFEACQFIYRSSHDNQSQLESDVHGSYGRALDTEHRFDLDDDERIEQVHVDSLDMRMLSYDDLSSPMKKIRGLKFLTTKGRSFPPDVDLAEDGVEVESFQGYTLGYVTGKSSASVDQLQFFWYRTVPN